jgi:hypothetical protein
MPGVLTLSATVQTGQALVISEIMYHPVDEALEYIELYNHRAVFEELDGFVLTGGIEYTFASGVSLGAKQYLVVAVDPNALQANYGIQNVVGPYSGRLDNSGERIELRNANNGIVTSVRYRDTHPWPIAADGTGHSLVLPGVSADPEEGSAWMASAMIGGSPGRAEPASPSAAALHINEIMANGSDWIELYNAGPGDVELSPLYLSDDAGDLLKFKLPETGVLQPGAFWAVDLSPEQQDTTFALKASGEAIFLTAASRDAIPIPLKVLDAVRYDALPPDGTFGRFPDGADRLCLLASPTQAGANDLPFNHAIVINEMMYHHGLRDDRYEYIELYNRSAASVSLDDWAFTDGIDYVFPAGTTLGPESYLVVAKDPNLLMSLYANLELGANLLGPYGGQLDDHSERIRLAYPVSEPDPETGEAQGRMVVADEVTYVDGGRWPVWADGRGTSLELRDPHGENDAPDAWAPSDESAKSSWHSFAFTIDSADRDYSHSDVTVFDMLLLNQGEVLLDDVQLTIDGQPRLENGGFENGLSDWRVLGNHARSWVTSEDAYSGTRALHLIATGHGDPGANRINQTITRVRANTVVFSGRAKWLRGSRYLLLRATRERRPQQPPWPSHSFELDMPLNQGTPGERNTAYVANRGPDILNVHHTPVIPRAGQAIVVSARVTDVDGVDSVVLEYRSEGSSAFTHTPMRDDGREVDSVAGDGIYTATIPPAGSGTMRAFRILASDGSATELFPTPLEASADVPIRTCLVRVNDTAVNSPFARYRIWMSDEVIATFRSRANLSNELMDCTFVYNETDVFYNARLRFRGSPFLRGGSGRDPRGRYGYRVTFNPDQRLGNRTEINLDNTENDSRGPLQERASYWFYRQLGLPYSRQEFIRLVINGNSYGKYEDVQKIDGDYVQSWFPDDSDGHIHKIDDYFEYDVAGTSHSNLDEGLKYDSQHPLIPETYRWGFEKRSHRDGDNWEHLFDFAVAMNTPSNSGAYEEAVEAVIDPEHFARVLAVRHAVGDWDSYGFDRGKNNYFYHSLPEGKWYLLPWDIDFTLGSGRGATQDLLSVNSGKFPEVQQFVNYPKYREMVLEAYSELVSGPWHTAWGTNEAPTAFDRFLDDAADALIADGEGSGRRDGIKQYVRDRRNYILTQVPAIEFKVTVDGADTTVTTEEVVVLDGVAPIDIRGISINGAAFPVEFTGKYTFVARVPVAVGANVLSIRGLDAAGHPVPGATETIIVVRVETCSITGVAPDTASQADGLVSLTLKGSGFTPGSVTSVALTQGSDEKGFEAQYVQSNQGFDRIDAATLLLNDKAGSDGAVTDTHGWINFSTPPGQGEFPSQELPFALPFANDGSNYAIRFTGVMVVPSPGWRYFGVNSDDGFSLHIDNKLVGEYSDARAPATTDVTQNRTAGTMSYQFPAAGRYPIQLDFFENGGGEAVELFQTNASGGDRRLINVNAELQVMRDLTTRVEAHDVVVLDSETMTCKVDISQAAAGRWNVVVTPPAGVAADCELTDALEIVE